MSAAVKQFLGFGILGEHLWIFTSAFFNDTPSRGVELDYFIDFHDVP
jgi:hypothetical protein